MDLSPTKLQFLDRIKRPDSAWKPRKDVKVVLVTLPSPWLISDRDMPNLGLLYVASYLREKGVNVQVADLCGTPQEYWFIPDGDVYGVSCTTPQYPYAKWVVEKIKARQPGAYVVMGGYHPSALPEWTLEDSGCDCVVKGDGEHAMYEIAKGLRQSFINADSIDNIDELPWPARDMIDIRSYHPIGTNAIVGPGAVREEYVLQSRGCPFSSLAGDTLIETVYGKISIKELAETYAEIGVFTYDHEEHRVKVATACNIMKTGIGKKLLRIHFRGGAHLDCTADHEVSTYKWGNQFVGHRYERKEAGHLKPGDRLLSIREELTGPGVSKYPAVCWSGSPNRRKAREKKHRLIIEWKLGRRLKEGEEVHHIDRDRTNSNPENLEVCYSRQEHMDKHPEIAERMTNANPMWIKDAVDRVRETCKLLAAGVITTAPSRNAYRKKGPARKNGLNSRYQIVRIEELPGRHDVYDMEVPGNNWFYANNVLVHNCAYCAQMLISGRRVRYRSPDCIKEEMVYLLEKYKVNRFYIFDDIFIIDKRRVYAFCDMVDSMWKEGYKFDWHCLARADVGSLELYQRMAASHCKQITYGLEHADNEILKRNLKECTAEQNMEAVVNAKKVGLNVRAQFIVGLPGETNESVEKLAEFIRQCPADRMAAHIFVPLPGSPVYTHPDKFGWDWNRGTDYKHYQTIGKPGEWAAHMIHKNSDDILRWANYLKAVIADKNVFRGDARQARFGALDALAVSC